MAALNSKLAVALVMAILVAITGSAAETKAEPEQEGPPELTAPLEPLRPGITEKGLLAELDAHNELRKSALLDYTVLRTYQVVDSKGKVHAEETGRMEFHAPDQKNFVTISEKGSGVIRRMALNRLISSEIEAARGKAHLDSAISSANYSLELLGEQQVGPYRCFVAQAVPKRKDKYLFEGKIWIDTADYAVVRIEGHPAKKPSFWIQRADFVRQYQKIGNFWFAQRDETFVQIRLYGKKILTIAHENYVVNGANNETSTTAQHARERTVLGAY